MTESDKILLSRAHSLIADLKAVREEFYEILLNVGYGREHLIWKDVKRRNLVAAKTKELQKIRVYFLDRHPEIEIETMNF